jgi:hypothetical protein
VYAVGRIDDMEQAIIEVWTLERVRLHYAVHHPAAPSASPALLEAYGRRQVLLAVLRRMPMSPALDAALALNEAAAAGAQQLTLADIADGTWLIPSPPPAARYHPPAIPATSAVTVNPAQYAHLIAQIQGLGLDLQQVTKYSQKLASIWELPHPASLEQLPLDIYPHLLKKLPVMAAHATAKAA